MEPLIRQVRAKRAEELVASWLAQRGFLIVARNLRLGHDELDIVARLGSLVVCVEVRTRAPQSFTTAFGSIDAKKRLRLRRAVRALWRQRYRYDSTVERMRIDTAAVLFRGGSAHIEYSAGAL